MSLWSTMPLKNKLKVISQTTLLGLGVIIGPCIPYTVQETEHAAILNFGKPAKVIVHPQIGENLFLDRESLQSKFNAEGIAYEEGAGLKVKAPWQSIIKIDKRIRRWDGYPEEVPTKDKKYLWTDATSRYFVEDPLQYLRTVGEESIAITKLSDVIDSQVRNSITKNDLIEVVRTSNREMAVTEKELADSVKLPNIEKGRTKILQEISENSRKDCHAYGIAIHPVGVLFKGLTYVDTVKKAVEQRMIQERARIAAKYRSEGEGAYQQTMGMKNREQQRIMSEAEKLAKDIEGSADGEATRIYNEGFVDEIKDKEGKVVGTYKAHGLSTDPDFYAFVRTMELYAKGLTGTNNVHLVLGKDSKLLRMLDGNFLDREKTNGVQRLERALEKYPAN